MLTTNRRMQEGARDLAIALSLGRAEEALYRLRAGGDLTPQDRGVFEAVAGIFREAIEGYRSATTAVKGGKYETRPGALRAFRLLLPVLREAKQERPTEYLSGWAQAVADVANGAHIPPERCDELRTLLKRVSLLAGTESLDALESKPIAFSFPLMGRIA